MYSILVDVNIYLKESGRAIDRHFSQCQQQFYTLYLLQNISIFLCKASAYVSLFTKGLLTARVGFITAC